MRSKVWIIKKRRPRTGLAEVSGVRPGRPRQVATGQLGIAPPPDMGQLVLVGEVVADITVVSLLERVSKPLREVLGRRPHGRPAVIVGLHSHNPSKGVVFHGAFRFVVEQLLNLNAMSAKKCPVQMNVPGGNTRLLNLTGRTENNRRGPEMRMIAVGPPGSRQRPAPISVDIATGLTDGWFGYCRVLTMAPSLVVNTMGERLISIFL